MRHANGTFWRTVGVLIGAVIGVGVFALPYTFAQSGFIVGALWLVLLGSLMTTLQLMTAEVSLHTPGQHRLVAQFGLYLGVGAGRLALIALTASIWGAMLAYLIAGGRLAHVLLGPAFGGSEAVYALGLGVLASLFVWRGLRVVSRLEMFAVGLILFLFSYIILSALPHVRWENVSGVHLSSFFLPYGVSLFALTGIGIVPEMKALLGSRNERRLPHAILVGMCIVVLLYLLFTFAVVGATGEGTSLTAIEGLVPMLGGFFGFIGTLLGTVTILSIHTMLATELFNTFHVDLKMSRPIAWLVVCGVPMMAYLFGIHDFAAVIGFVGAVFTGILGIMIVWMYERMRRSPVCVRHHCLDVPSFLSWLVIVVLIIGLILQVASLFT